MCFIEMRPRVEQRSLETGANIFWSAPAAISWNRKPSAWTKSWPSDLPLRPASKDQNDSARQVSTSFQSCCWRHEPDMDAVKRRPIELETQGRLHGCRIRPTISNHLLKRWSESKNDHKLIGRSSFFFFYIADASFNSNSSETESKNDARFNSLSVSTPFPRGPGSSWRSWPARLNNSLWTNVGRSFSKPLAFLILRGWPSLWKWAIGYTVD